MNTFKSVVNCSQIFCTFAVETTLLNRPPAVWCCELLSNFLYFCSRNNSIAVLLPSILLWIALKFFVLLQSKQLLTKLSSIGLCCELLSNFLYFCSRNNRNNPKHRNEYVVNCSQIFCTFAVETTVLCSYADYIPLWIALKFFVLLQSKQLFVLLGSRDLCCELLSNFLYFCSRNNVLLSTSLMFWLWIALKFFVLLQSKQQLIAVDELRSSCELLSNFLYFCSRNNSTFCTPDWVVVVNCSQIFCTFAVETTCRIEVEQR